MPVVYSISIIQIKSFTIAVNFSICLDHYSRGNEKKSVIHGNVICLCLLRMRGHVGQPHGCLCPFETEWLWSWSHHYNTVGFAEQFVLMGFTKGDLARLRKGEGSASMLLNTPTSLQAPCCSLW